MNKTSCDIVKDLLPLYYDKVCSDDSRKMVEEHISNCSDCKDELNRMQAEIKLPKAEIEKNKNDLNVIKSLSVSWKRLKLKAFLKGASITTILLLAIFLGYNGLFKWNFMNVQTDVVKITEVSQSADGKIVYHSELTDGYDLNRLKYDMDADGNFYMTPLRPIIKQKPLFQDALASGYTSFNIKTLEMNRGGAEIKAVYYGTPKDHILIWKKGMYLPKASKEVEDHLGFN